jgi:hypothetical protein
MVFRIALVRFDTQPLSQTRSATTTLQWHLMKGCLDGCSSAAKDLIDLVHSNLGPNAARGFLPPAWYTTFCKPLHLHRNPRDHRRMKLISLACSNLHRWYGARGHSKSSFTSKYLTRRSTGFYGTVLDPMYIGTRGIPAPRCFRGSEVHRDTEKGARGRGSR